MSVYERPNIARLSAYTPGEQPQRGRWVKLNTNENAYPPAPAVLKAIAKVPADQLRRYPPPHAPAFRAIAAKLHKVKPQQIIATNGGDELLRLMVTVYCEPTGAKLTRRLGVATPSYSLYPVLADIQNTRLSTVALRDDWSLPDDAATKWLDEKCGLVMIVNPHAPSGSLQTIQSLAKLARSLKKGNCVLMVDEAYVNFAPVDALDLVRPASRMARGLDNVILLRSLSKGYSLAGLRFGYGVGHPGIVAALNKAKDSYPTDILAQAAACAALTGQAYAKSTWKRIIAQRKRVMDQLTRRGWIMPESASNFILATPPKKGPDAGTIYQALKARGVFVRYFDQDRLRDKLRITIGTPAQNAWLLREMDRIG